MTLMTILRGSLALSHELPTLSLPAAHKDESVLVRSIAGVCP
ncbi:hypothetical protein [Pseudomonas sp. NPDC086251]